MKDIYKPIIKIFLLSVLSYYSVARADDAPLLKQYLEAPFSEIMLGSKVDKEILDHLPKMSPSTLVTFYNDCESSILHQFSREPSIKAVSQPERENKIRKESDIIFVVSLSAGHVLSKYDSSGTVSISEGKQKVATVKTGDSLAFTVDSEKMLSTKNELIEQKTATDTSIMNSHVKSQGEQNTAKGSSTMNSHVKSQGEQNTAKGSFTMDSHIKSLSEQHTVRDTSTMNTDVMDLGEQKSAYDKYSLSKIAEYSVSQGEYDSDDLAQNNDSDTLDGLYDKDNIFLNLDSFDEVTLNEIEKYKSYVCSEPELKKVFDEKVVHDSKLPCTPAFMDLEIEILPVKIYFGHKAEFMIQVKNSGGSPIYNVLLFGGVPPRTTFVGFKNARKEYRGYAEFYAKKCNTFGIKLVRPLFPGDKIVTTVIARLDRWTVKDDATVNKRNR